MDSASLRSFVAAVEEQSLSRAALRENLVISAVSKRIAELERQAGVVLLIRHGRGVSPTPAGEMLFQRAKAILKAMSLAGDALAAYTAEGTEKIRLLANPSTTVQFMHQDLAPFLKANDDCRVHLSEGHSVDIPRRILDGEADIGIYHALHPAPGLVSHVYRKDRVCLVVPLHHRFAERNEVWLEEVIDETFLGYFPRHTLESFLALADDTISRPLTVRSEISNYEARCRMVVEGLGIAIVPEIIARNYLSMMRFSILRLRDPWAQRTMYACIRDADSAPEQVKSLLAHLCASSVSAPFQQQTAIDGKQGACQVG